MENDGNVRWISEELGAECVLKDDKLGGMPGVIKTELGYSLVPGLVEGEGQYCSALVKTGISGAAVMPSSRRRPAAGKDRPAEIPKDICLLFDREVMLSRRGENVIALPKYLKDNLKIISGDLPVQTSYRRYMKTPGFLAEKIEYDTPVKWLGTVDSLHVQPSTGE
jgi:hypothetical protein